MAQLKHTISQKEELLRLYARDATERDEAEAEGVTEGEESKPEWVVTLTEECRELRESNLVLKMEADQLRKETADIETKERELVQQCLEQFSGSLVYTPCMLHQCAVYSDDPVIGDVSILSLYTSVYFLCILLLISVFSLCILLYAFFV